MGCGPLRFLFVLTKALAFTTHVWNICGPQQKSEPPLTATTYPDKFWHCMVRMVDQRDHAIVNDLTFDDLQRSVVTPWIAGRPFSVAGTIVRSSSDVAEIRVSRTDHPQENYAEQHNAEMRNRGIADMVAHSG